MSVPKSDVSWSLARAILSDFPVMPVSSLGYGTFSVLLCIIRLLVEPLPAPDQSEYQRHGEDDQKHEKQDLRDLDGAGGDPAKAEERRYERNYEKYCCPI